MIPSDPRVSPAHAPADFRVRFDDGEQEYVATCTAWPQLRWFHRNPVEALDGLLDLLAPASDREGFRREPDAGPAADPPVRDYEARYGAVAARYEDLQRSEAAPLPGGWVCDNYEPPQTCLNVGSTTPCDRCAEVGFRR